MVFEFSKAKNTTVKEVFANLTNSIEVTNKFDLHTISKIANDLIDDVNKTLQQTNITRAPFILKHFSSDWVYLNTIRGFYEVLQNPKLYIPINTKFYAG